MYSRPSIINVNLELNNRESVDGLSVETTRDRVLSGGISREACVMNLDWDTLIIIGHFITPQRLVGKELVLPVFMSSVGSDIFPIISGGRVAFSRILAASGRGGEFTQPLPPILQCLLDIMTTSGHGQKIVIMQ